MAEVRGAASNRNLHVGLVGANMQLKMAELGAGGGWRRKVRVA